MINPFQEVNWDPSPTEVRKLGVTMVLGVAILSLVWLAVRSLRHPFVDIWIGPAIVTGSVSVLSVTCVVLPANAGRVVYWFWYGLSCCLGIVVSNVTLMGVFYCVFTPYAIVARVISGRDPLQLSRPGNGCKTNWHDCPQRTDKKTYLRQY